MTGSENCSEIYLNTVVNRPASGNHVNPFLYLVSVRNCPSPGHGVIYIFIGDLTPKSAILSLTILSAHK